MAVVTRRAVLALLPLLLLNAIRNDAEDGNHAVQQKPLDLLQIVSRDFYASLPSVTNTLLQIHSRQNSPIREVYGEPKTRKESTRRIPKTIST